MSILLACTVQISQLKLENPCIESVARVVTGILKLGDCAVAEHRLVKGRMHERKVGDRVVIAFTIEMLLPMLCSGRFYSQG